MPAIGVFIGINSRGASARVPTAAIRWDDAVALMWDDGSFVEWDS